MKIRAIPRSYGAASVVLTLAVGCGGLADIPRSAEPALLRGRALDATGVPVPDVDVYVVQDNVGRVVAVTGPDGQFQVDEAPTGRVILTLNDRQGNGTVREMALFPEGENDAGDLFLDVLELSPRIVEFSGVGYEERVSLSAGDLLFPVFSQTGENAYAARRPLGSELYDLVQLDTSSGPETILATEIDVDASQHNPLRLISNRLLACAVQAHPFTLIFDVHNGAQVTGHGPPVSPDALWVTGNTFFAVSRGASGPLYGDAFYPQYNFLLAAIDLAGDPADSTNRRFLTLGGDRWLTGFDVLTHNDSVLIYAPFVGCADHPTGCSADELLHEVEGRREIFIVELDRFQLELT